MKQYLKLARVHHYIKNILVIIPLFFAVKLFTAELIVNCVFGFFAFSLLSSVIYIINDIHDAPLDRLHEKKKNRPIASGAVKIKSAYIFAFCLLAAACVCAFFAGRENFAANIYLIVYFTINIFYSRGGKNIPILDIALLASGFLIRILYGAAITGIEISNWLYLTVISGAFYLGLGKRRNELRQNSDTSRIVLKSYNYAFLDKMMYMFLAMAVIFYSLWAAQSTKSVMIWSVPIVMLICMRYALLAEGNSDGDPIEVFVHDKPLILLAALYAAAMCVILYF